MRLIFRLVGTWLLGLALILLIIDGTKSLGANAVVMTTLGETWNGISPDSLATLQGFFATRLFAPVLDGVVAGLLGLPGWLVLAVPGMFIAWLGRTRRSRIFLRQDQI